MTERGMMLKIKHFIIEECEKEFDFAIVEEGEGGILIKAGRDKNIKIAMAICEKN